ncbi:MAG: hypothetical protein QOJ01_1281 [Solirubrobacterales bacterium]|jgi:Rrf2 family protein|nr:hypothetical protein [Solirubrobacterales bacterium]
MLVLAASEPGEPVKGDSIAAAQEIPLPFLENILAELRHQGLVHSRRGQEGGYWLAMEAKDITVAEVIRAVEGPLATVRGESADDLAYSGEASGLKDVWLSLRGSVRGVLENVTLAQVLAGDVSRPAPEKGAEAAPLGDG